MHRKEYKTITIKIDVFKMFLDACKEARQKDKKIRNSSFMELLLKDAKKVVKKE